jgi:myo-inositol-1(or 4)-monophosphatase
VEGIPEFCVSIAMVHKGRAVAAGICNPATGETFLGALDYGLTYNGSAGRASRRADLKGALILASRSETKRGEWKKFAEAPFRVQPMGSVAYKLARVAAGLADGTFTLVPKHEWDVAAGVALVESSGGFSRPLNREEFAFNLRSPLLPGLVACGPQLRDELLKFLEMTEQAEVQR